MDILDYLNERNPAAGRRLTERFEAVYGQLADFPQSGARGRAPGTRRLIVTPYILTYREISAELLEIIDIRHGRRRPEVTREDI
jgi:plasmid stabilization system protein ParE